MLGVAAFQVVGAAVGNQEAVSSQSFQQLAVLTEEVHAVVVVLGVTAVLDHLVAYQAGTILIEVVLGTVNLSPSRAVERRTVIVAHAAVHLNPHAAEQLAVFVGQIKSNAAILMMHGTLRSLLGAAAEVVPGAVDGVPAAGDVAGNQVVIVAVSLEQAGVGERLAAHSADQLIAAAGEGVLGRDLNAGVHHSLTGIADDTIRVAGLCTGGFLALGVGIHVTGGGDRRTPLDHRAAALTVSTAGISRLGAVRILVFQCHSGVGMVDVVAGRRSANQHGRHRLAATEFGHHAGDVSHLTGEDGVVDGHGGLIGGCRFGLLGHIVEARPGPDAHRNAQQGHLAKGEAVLGTGQRHLDCVLHRVDINHGTGRGGKSLVAFVIQHLIFHFEAVGNNHVLQFPSVGGVQADGRLHLRNIFRSGGGDVHIVDRVYLGGLAGVIVAFQYDQGFLLAINGDLVRHLRTVVPVILELEGHAVLTVGQFHSRLGGHGVTSGFGFHFVAVDVDLGGSQVQAGDLAGAGGFGNAGSEAHQVAGDHHAICQGNALIGGGVLGIGDDGGIAIFHSSAVVQGNVVNVEGQPGRGFRLNVSTHPGGRTGIGRIRRRHGRQVVILADVDGRIHPAVGGDIVFLRAVQVRLQARFGAGEHEVILHAGNLRGIGDMSRVGVELGLEGQASAAFGDVEPEAQSGSVQAVGHIAEHAGLTNVEQHIVGPVAEVGCAVIVGDAQGVVAVLDLTVFGGGQEGMGVVLGAELTAQRIGTHQRVVHAVGKTPGLGISEAHPVRHIAIFKVPAGNDLGALAELKLVVHSGQRVRIVIGERQHRTCFGLICGGGVYAVDSIPGTVLIGEGPGEGRCLVIHIPVVRAILHGGIKGHRLTIGDHGALSAEVEGIGMYNVDGILEGLTTHSKLHHDVTDLTIGHEVAIGDSAEGIIRQGPHAALRHSHLSTGGIDGLGGKGIGGHGSEVIILATDHGLMEDTRSHALGLGNEDGVQGCTLSAVGGGGTHGQLRLARALGDEGGRATAVTVEGPLAAQSQHHLAHLVVALTNGVISATTVGLAQDQGAVSLNTDHRTRSGSGGALHRGSHQLTVLDQPSEVGANAVPVVLFELIATTAQLHSAILLDSQVGSTATSV